MILMHRKAFFRTMLASIGAFLLFAVATPSASAADDTESVFVAGILRGSITHIDNGDYFRVCDKYDDGIGVMGYLKYQGRVAAKIGDGDDAGCNTFQYDVRSGLMYHMYVCFHGECGGTYFYE